jgi:hypothetical protein
MRYLACFLLWVSMNKISYFRDINMNLDWVIINLEYSKNTDVISSYLIGDIQGSIEFTDEMTEKIKISNYDTSVYESQGNCCLLEIEADFVRITNVYLEKVVRVKKEDMLVILNKWAEYLKSQNRVDHSWNFRDESQ